MPRQMTLIYKNDFYVATSSIENYRVTDKNIYNYLGMTVARSTENNNISISDKSFEIV